MKAVLFSRTDDQGFITEGNFFWALVIHGGSVYAFHTHTFSESLDDWLEFPSGDEEAKFVTFTLPQMETRITVGNDRESGKWFVVVNDMQCFRNGDVGVSLPTSCRIATFTPVDAAFPLQRSRVAPFDSNWGYGVTAFAVELTDEEFLASKPLADDELRLNITFDRNGVSLDGDDPTPPIKACKLNWIDLPWKEQPRQ